MDRFLARLERRFGKYTLPGLTYYLVAIQAFVFAIELTNNGFCDVLRLDRALVLKGQVWRLFTFLFVPATTSPIWILFSLFWLYTMGTALEKEWGAFKYQAYWLIGILLTTIAAFTLNVSVSNVYLIMSLFLAFATLFPEYKLMILFVIPVSAKWLALLDGLLLLAMVGIATGWERVFPFVAVGNYLLFFTPQLIDLVRGFGKQAGRSRAFSKYQRSMREGEAAKARRACSVCGVTDEDRSIDFRVCTCEKCGGKPTEFCMQHARSHREVSA